MKEFDFETDSEYRKVTWYVKDLIQDWQHEEALQEQWWIWHQVAINRLELPAMNRQQARLEASLVSKMIESRALQHQIATEMADFLGCDIGRLQDAKSLKRAAHFALGWGRFR